MVEPSLAVAPFTTPIVAFDLPDMAGVNLALTELLLAEERSVPSWQRANIGGWHSPPDLSRRGHPALQHLMRGIVDHVAMNVGALAAAAELTPPSYRYGVTAWAMVMRNGHYVMPHDHGDSHWSVAYYVDAGDDAPAPSGHLAFVDPRRTGRTIPELELFPSTFDVPARTSTLVIFPGWLQHYVHAYRGERPRICISANVTMEPERMLS